MTKEQRDAAIKLLTHYEQLTAENISMKALLAVLQKHGAFKNFAFQGQDSTWEEELAYLMKSTAREKVRQSVLPLLQQIEQAFQDDELSRWLVEHPPKGPVN